MAQDKIEWVKKFIARNYEEIVAEDVCERFGFLDES